MWIGFQNAEYSAITDIKSVMITNKSDFKQFIKDLVSVYKIMSSDEKANMDWDRSPLYKLNLYDFAKNRM